MSLFIGASNLPSTHASQPVTSQPRPSIRQSVNPSIDSWAKRAIPKHRSEHCCNAKGNFQFERTVRYRPE